ncbi:MAG TPA: DUF6531 domain-containing protein [Caldisericia bacterium]|nr:DUF6531 domain-containing protein [Caldisericia bacterium]
MKNLKKFAVVMITLLLVTSSFALLPSSAFADEKIRTVPPSEAPVDGEKVEKPKKKDLTPEGINEYELYQEASGVYKVIIKPVVESHDESEYSLNAAVRTAPSTGAALADFISLTNTNGAVTTKGMLTIPPGIPATALEIENSVNTNPVPPPPNITVNSKTFVNYGISGLISNKDIIQDAYLDFSSTTGTNIVPISVNIYDVGTTWSSATMTWATMPPCIPAGTPGTNQLFDYNSTPNPPTVSFTWTPMATGTPRFDLADLFKGYFYSAVSNIGFGFDTTTTITNMGAGMSGINNGVIPNLVIIYSKNEGGSPSGNDMSFGNGAGNVRVNPWAGETVYRKRDIGYSVINNSNVQFIRTYNSNSTVNYGFGKGWTSNFHQTLTVDSNNVATWRRADGSYLSFLPNGTNSWASPEFTNYTLSIDTNNKYVISDGLGTDMRFNNMGYPEQENNWHGCQIDLSWNASGLLTSVSGDSTGRSLSFTYDAYNRLTDITDPEGDTVSYSYDANNRLTGFTDGESNTTTFIYDTSDRLVTLRNPASKDIDFTYTTDVSGYQDIAVKNHGDTTIASINVSSSTAAITDAASNTLTYTFNSRGYATGISYPNTSSVSMVRDTMNRVTSFSDAEDNSFGYIYASSGLVSQITRPDAKVMKFEYDAYGQLTKYTNAMGKISTYSYNATTNDLTSITNPENETISFGYTGDLLTSITIPYEDCSENTSTVTWDISYDTNNYVDELESPDGKIWSYTNNEVGRVESFTDPNNNTWNYTYDGNGRLTQAKDPYLNTWDYTYDSAGRLTQVSDTLSNATTFAYDNDGRLSSITDAESNVVSVTRNTLGQVTTVTDPEGNDTVYTYDSLGRVTAITNAENETVEFTYDDNSNVTKVTDPLDNETDFTYDSLNRLTKVTDELNNETDFAYDDNSNLTSITNPLDKVTSMTYDDLNRLLTVTDDDSNVWSRTYLASGKLATLDGPATADQEFCYNNDGLLTSSYNSDGEDQTYTYDSAGRLTKITDALGNETDITYDNLNRVKKVYDAVDNYIEYTYDAMGNITAIRDRRGNSTSYTYDDIYRVTSVTDALSNVHEYTYDKNSRVTKVEAPPQTSPPTTNFSYDDVGRLTSFTDPLTNSGSFVYNDNGLVTSRTDRNGDTTSYTYDDLNRLTKIAYSLTDDVDFTYDNASRLISMVDSIGTTEWTYNDIGRITSTDDPWDFTHSLVYNAEGFLTSLTAEGDARTYAWNSAGQMTSATRDSQATTFDYNAASWITDIDLPTGIDTDYTYNSRGWITDLVAKDSNLATILDLDYTYDANGNVTSEDVGTDTWSYTYDALNRLTAVDKPGTSDDIAYTYDVRGNRTDIDVGGTDNTDLTFNIADQLTRVDYDDGSYRVYTYDDNGNCTDMDYCTGSCMSSVVIQNKEDWEERQANFNHYPFTTAPRELLRSTALNPHLPTSSDVDVYFNSMLDWTNPELASYVRRQKWNPYKENRGTNSDQTLNSLKTNPLSTLSRDYNPSVALVYDESTDYTYDKENRLTHVDLPDGSDVDFSYDGLGRRLTKVITDGTDVTTIKYHYVGGQITTIEIDAEDDEVAYRDETIHIHLGPNSYPISFEWVRYDYTEEVTLDDTYYYHYDLHGNVLKVTDDSETVKITYLYDVLGEITSETNPDGIPNFFTYRGATQTLTDSELELYFGGGFYRPDLGVSLGSTGIASNPTSSSAIGLQAKISKANMQHQIHGSIADVNSKLEMPNHGKTKSTPAPATGSAPPTGTAPPPVPRGLDLWSNLSSTLPNSGQGPGPMKQSTVGGKVRALDLISSSRTIPSWDDLPLEVKKQLLINEGWTEEEVEKYLDEDGNLKDNTPDQLKSIYNDLKENLVDVAWKTDGQNGVGIVMIRKRNQAPVFYWPPTKKNEKQAIASGEDLCLGNLTKKWMNYGEQSSIVYTWSREARAHNVGLIKTKESMDGKTKYACFFNIFFRGAGFGRSVITNGTFEYTGKTGNEWVDNAEGGSTYYEYGGGMDLFDPNGNKTKTFDFMKTGVSNPFDNMEDRFAEYLAKYGLFLSDAYDGVDNEDEYWIFFYFNKLCGYNWFEW